MGNCKTTFVLAGLEFAVQNEDFDCMPLLGGRSHGRLLRTRLWHGPRQGNDLISISRCMLDNRSTTRGTCQRIEKVIQCVESINGDCAKNAFLAGSLTLDYGRYEVYSNEPCFHQYFDEYFNQDGLCSFQAAKDLYKCVRSNRNRPDSAEEEICNDVEKMSTCVQELHPTCLGFVKRQAPFVVEPYRQWLDGKEMPSCV